MEWLWVVLFFGGAIGIGVAWDKLKERGGKAGRAAEATGEVAGSIGRGLIRLYGLALGAAGVIGVIWLGSAGWQIWLAAALLVGYGLYLVFGGSWVIW